ncbi:MAG: tetratricopeptide repeat protein [candidate division Zixibacteria bacterium]
MRKEKRIKGYLLVVSLFSLILLFSGCATKQDVLRVEEKVNQIRADQRLLKAKIDAIDSLIASSAEQDNRLRVDMRSSVEDLNEQLNQLQNQLNDLNQMIYNFSQRVAMQPIQPQVVQQPPPAEDTTSRADDTTEVETISSVDCTELWDQAFKDMRRGQYDLALSGFSDYIKFCPEGNLLDNSQYWIAECYYEMEMNERAIEEYTKLIDGYPESEKISSAYFKIGRSYEKMDNNEKALEYYIIIQEQFPGSVQHEQVKDKIERWQKEQN